jgi:hypothetical protein
MCLHNWAFHTGKKGDYPPVPHQRSMPMYSGPRNLDNENGWNKVLNYHAQTVQCYL